MKFRKKPIEIEAVQFDGTEDGMWNIADKLDIYQDAISFLDLKDKMVCHTLEGDMVADKGDWIIKGVKGEIYPCKPDIFEMTYDKVENNEDAGYNTLRDRL